MQTNILQYKQYFKFYSEAKADLDGMLMLKIRAFLLPVVSSFAIPVDLLWDYFLQADHELVHCKSLTY